MAHPEGNPRIPTKVPKIVSVAELLYFQSTFSHPVNSGLNSDKLIYSWIYEEERGQGINLHELHC